MNTPIKGHCDPKFQTVADRFRDNFEKSGEVGASCLVSIDGKTVVDLWGGYKDKAKTQEWEENTLSIVFSCTKAATALCAQILIDRGALDLDAPVSRYWPEFAQNGKEGVSVKMMLGHQSALPALRGPVKPGGFYDFDYMAERLAAEEPFWEPGTDNGYHMLTFGWTLGEMVRRLSGKSFGTFFKDEIADPLGLEFYIGAPAAAFPRIAPMINANMGPDALKSEFWQNVFTKPQSISHLALMNNGGHYHDTEAAWRAEIGGAGGISNARAIAKMFAPLAQNKDAYLSSARIKDMSGLCAQSKKDRTLTIPTRFGQGFMLKMDNRTTHPGEGNSLIIGEHAFGHVGAGGSIGFADPEAGLAFGYTMTQMGAGILLNPRGQGLVDAVYSALG